MSRDRCFSLRVPVGEGMIGRVVNPLGEPIDDQGPILAGAHALAPRIDRTWHRRFVSRSTSRFKPASSRSTP